MATCINGFADSSLFRICDDGFPYYYMEGDSYLAKFKTGLKLDDVIDFNMACDTICERSLLPRNVDLVSHEEFIPLRNTGAKTSYTMDEHVLEKFSVKSQTKKAVGKSRIPKKIMQKYKNRQRDVKHARNNEDMEILATSLIETDKEIKAYEKMWTTKMYFKQFVVGMIADKSSIFEWKRIMRVWSAFRRAYYFEKNGILHYYYPHEGTLYVYETYIKIEKTLDGTQSIYFPATDEYDELIQQGKYVHISMNKTDGEIQMAIQMEMNIQMESDRYEFDMEPDYMDIERHMDPDYYPYDDDDMMEYYADF